LLAALNGGFVASNFVAASSAFGRPLPDAVGGSRPQSRHPLFSRPAIGLIFEIKRCACLCSYRHGDPDFDFGADWMCA